MTERIIGRLLTKYPKICYNFIKYILYEIRKTFHAGSHHHQAHRQYLHRLFHQRIPGGATRAGRLYLFRQRRFRAPLRHPRAPAAVRIRRPRHAHGRRAQAGGLQRPDPQERDELFHLLHAGGRIYPKGVRARLRADARKRAPQGVRLLQERARGRDGGGILARVHDAGGPRPLPRHL